MGSESLVSGCVNNFGFSLQSYVQILGWDFWKVGILSGVVLRASCEVLQSLAFSPSPGSPRNVSAVHHMNMSTSPQMAEKPRLQLQ